MICVLTYRRSKVLQEALSGLAVHCRNTPVAVFEDCGNRDDTVDFLTDGKPRYIERNDLLAREHIMLSRNGADWRAFIGTHNLGVAGNSNRALKHFMDSDCDHLCLLNDDLHILGDFAGFYRKAHKDLDIGFFCFCDFTHHESYKWLSVRSRGYGIKILPRLTGIMLSLTRSVVEKIGYFDTRFGKFGEEHCDYTYRARFAGFVKLDGQDQNGLDLEPPVPLLRHQEVATSVEGLERAHADAHATQMMQQVSREYRFRHYYRDFCLREPHFAGSQTAGGIPTAQMPGYKLVSAIT